jgi:hypothetical protein
MPPSVTVARMIRDANKKVIEVDRRRVLVDAMSTVLTGEEYEKKDALSLWNELRPLVSAPSSLLAQPKPSSRAAVRPLLLELAKVFGAEALRAIVGAIGRPPAAKPASAARAPARPKKPSARKPARPATPKVPASPMRKRGKKQSAEVTPKASVKRAKTRR